jgi:hypothetical protein
MFKATAEIRKRKRMNEKFTMKKRKMAGFMQAGGLFLSRCSENLCQVDCATSTIRKKVLCNQLNIY